MKAGSWLCLVLSCLELARRYSILRGMRSLGRGISTSRDTKYVLYSMYSMYTLAGDLRRAIYYGTYCYITGTEGGRPGRGRVFRPMVRTRAETLGRQRQEETKEERRSRGGGGAPAVYAHLDACSRVPKKRSHRPTDPAERARIAIRPPPFCPTPQPPSSLSVRQPPIRTPAEPRCCCLRSSNNNNPSKLALRLFVTDLT